MSHRRVRSSVRCLVAAVVASTALAACGGGDDGDVIRVYSGRHYDLEVAFEQFSEETGISIEFLTGNDAELRERIAEEGEETQADVYLTVDAGNLAVAAEEGLFTPLDSAALEGAVPENLRDPDGNWFGLTLRARTIVYHPDQVAPDEVPTTYEELAEPAWEGRVCLRDSSNVYTQSLVASLIAHHGEDEALAIVEGWADNAEILNNDVLILESIAEGLCDVGITNHYYLARLLEDDPDFPVELVWADQDGRGVHVNISGGGVTRYADDPELARQFLEWLATDGQSVFVDGNHEYPVNPDVEPEPLIAETFGTDFVRDELAAAEFGALNADAVRLMDEAGYR
ncbi:MAG: extracellular solute-binding protein [Actinomycetota bacterium]|nr:extracellular solute-binding protein [Actinomycetota bacterium]